MIGRRCKASNGFSRPVLIARDLFCKPEFLSGYLSQVKYCGGYSGEDPPLTIPNREVKLTSADGTATPRGRVGSCRFSGHLIEDIQSGVLFLYYRSWYRFLRALRLVEMTKGPFAWSESQERELSRNDRKGSSAGMTAREFA